MPALSWAPSRIGSSPIAGSNVGANGRSSLAGSVRGFSGDGFRNVADDGQVQTIVSVRFRVRLSECGAHDAEASGMHPAGRLMTALRSVRALGLGSWCIGAGAIRNLVWDTLHGFAPTVSEDVIRGA